MQEIAPGLYQAALAHASTWTAAPQHVDVAVLMASQAEPLPAGIEHQYFPIDDDAAGCNHLDEVRSLASTLAQQRVLTVCHMGENRSGLLSALILIARGMDAATAVRTVQTRGPHNSPTQAHSFWNPGFVKQVLAL